MLLYMYTQTDFFRLDNIIFQKNADFKSFFDSSIMIVFLNEDQSDLTTCPLNAQFFFICFVGGRTRCQGMTGCDHSETGGRNE